MSEITEHRPTISRGFWLALAANFVWINISEVWRYLYVVRPMLLEEKAGLSGIAPFDLTTFAIWGVWDTLLIVSCTAFFWMWFSLRGAGLQQAMLAATSYAVTIFGLIWIGIANMGLASFQFFWVATPLAWAEMAIAATMTAAIFRAS
ncbi:hypothetical protein [Qipengyuania sp. DGS5-3]|uniref:hypothetical protein n=1 Tax=Qipengyuania sp. DGS5-3 TaxID=3349632 RepID=UPI0036D298A2